VSSELKAPYPYFGGKARVASLVWSRFGEVRNYVEPFFGSGAVLLERPLPFGGVETVNDADGFVANFWRALQADPAAVAHYADWPVNENDLHARHAWLVGQRDMLQAQLEGDPDYCDVKVAGWWVWGMACWIGGEFCSGKGPWHVIEDKDGTRRLVRSDKGDAGRGANRKLVHLGDAGRGVHRSSIDSLADYMTALAERMRRVRVCCGDWSRVMGNTPTQVFTPAAIFLDPPYADTAKRTADIYRVDCQQVAHAVREWAIANGGNPNLRICLAGYEGEHAMPDSWECVAWKANGGYGSQSAASAGRTNANRERLWFSPHCLCQESLAMFDTSQAI
jgi:hypothetical protein